MKDDRLLRKLVRYKVRGPEYIFERCPSCGNDHWNFQVNFGYGGVFKCWVCSYSGRLGGLARKFGVFDFVAEESEAAPVERSYLNVDEWSTVFGHRSVITSKSWWDYFIGKEVDTDMLVEWGVRFKEDTVLFPIYDGKELMYWTVRDMVGGRWYQPAGWSRKDVVIRKLKPGSSIVVVESMVDGLKVWKAGYSVLILLGTVLYIDDVRFLKRLDKDVIIGLDSDVPLDKLSKIQDSIGMFRYIDVSPYEDPSDVPFDDLVGLLKDARTFGVLDKVQALFRGGHVSST